MKAKAEDLKKSLDDARKVFQTTSKDKLLPPATCKKEQDFAEVLRGRKEAQNKEQRDFVENMSDKEKKYYLRINDAVTTACNSKTEESYLNVLRIGHEKDTHTCLVSSNTFKQSFSHVDDIINDAEVWVAKGDPSSGPCGIVQLSRFEKDKEDLFGVKVNFWKYTAKKAITNKQGFLPGRVACKDLDEDENIYDWRSKEYAVDCDYIEFSPF
jgi:hypothetical protein